MIDLITYRIRIGCYGSGSGKGAVNKTTREGPGIGFNSRSSDFENILIFSPQSTSQNILVFRLQLYILLLISVTSLFIFNNIVIDNFHSFSINLILCHFI